MPYCVFPQGRLRTVARLVPQFTVFENDLDRPNERNCSRKRPLCRWRARLTLSTPHGGGIGVLRNSKRRRDVATCYKDGNTSLRFATRHGSMHRQLSIHTRAATSSTRRTRRMDNAFPSSPCGASVGSSSVRRLIGITNSL